MDNQKDKNQQGNQRPQSQGNQGGKSSQGSWRDNWEDTKGSLKSQHGNLTDEDLNYEQGKEEDVYKRVGNRLGKNRQETEKLFNDTYEGGLETAEVGGEEE